MAEAAFEELVAGVTGGETPRVWSLLVTVFGETAQAPSARIGGAVLTRLTERIGIRPEATRVALHRLRKDGWIESRRSGRVSDHGLSDWGRRQSAAATPRIYATGPAAAEAWLLVCDPARSGNGLPGVALSGTLAIAAGRPAETHVFATPLPTGHPLPDWMRDRICPPDIVAQALALDARLSDLAAHLPDPSRLGALEIAALRVLIVHSWRRIVLKAPQLPDHVFPAAWPGASCRRRVAELLNRLPKPTLACLEAGIGA